MQKGSWRKKIVCKAVLVHTVILAVSLLFVLVTKQIALRFPQRQCVMVELLGLYCPGCGGTRAVTHLLSLRFKEAFLSYPPLLFFLSALLWYDGHLCYALVKNSEQRLPKIKTRHMITLAVLVLVLFLLRNLALLWGYDYLGDILRV